MQVSHIYHMEAFQILYLYNVYCNCNEIVGFSFCRARAIQKGQRRSYCIVMSALLLLLFEFSMLDL